MLLNNQRARFQVKLNPDIFYIWIGLYIFWAFLPTPYIKNYTPVNNNLIFSPYAIHKSKETAINHYPIIPMSDQLWQYLRKGLNYLETSGKDYPPDFVHPGGRAFGPLGLTQIAIQDVINNHVFLTSFEVKDVFKNREIYDDFAKAYADLLLRHYLKINYWNMPKSQVFDILQKAWFLGPGLYLKSGEIIPARKERANEYISVINPITKA